MFLTSLKMITMKSRNLILVLALLMVSLTSLSITRVAAHEGHFNVDVGDQYEFVWTSLKDADGFDITDGSYSYPDAPNSSISQGDHFYIEIDTINITSDSPTAFGHFTFADGSTTDEVALMGYFKAMNSSTYNWTYWKTYYEGNGYNVTWTSEYFQYEYENDSSPNYMRFRWENSTGAMLEWELHGFWIGMMGFGTLSEIEITRYESVTDYGVSEGDRIYLKWDILLDADSLPITDGSYSYPDAPNSSISQGDTSILEITTINTSMMGTVAYGRFIFGNETTPEVILMGYVKSREWSHWQLYYIAKGYTIIDTATEFGYDTGSGLTTVWDRSTGVVVDFHLSGFWVNMMGFGTVSEIRLVKAPHEGHFNVFVGDQYEFVWTSLKDADGLPITDGSFVYPDANDSMISQGDNFYLEVLTVNMTMGMSGLTPSVYGEFTFANGATTGEVYLMGYFKPMASWNYTWEYWEDYYISRGYGVNWTAEYFEYVYGDNASDPNYMRFRWDAVDGAMLTWELRGMWPNMMGFGTVKEIRIDRYVSVPTYGVSVGDKIHLQWAVLLDADGMEITDGSYAYPDAPDSAISQGDYFYIEITTINTSMMGTTVYGKFVFGTVSSPEVMLMGYVKTMEWNHWQLYYAAKGYIIISTATQFGYQSGSLMGGPLLRMIWDRSTGSVVEFHLKGFWIQMMGFGTPSEIKLAAGTPPVDTTTTPTTTLPTTTGTTTTTTTSPSVSGFEFGLLVFSMIGVIIIFNRRRR